MKETSFIKQNISKWTTYEKELTKQKKDPETVSKLFVEITDDLAYAQTFYKNRSVRVYLNGIAQLLFNDINKRNRIKFKKILNFWSLDLPIILYKTRFELLFSFIVFSLMVGIGLVTSIYEPDFAETILGENYIEMTVENIKNNDPMAVYKKQNGFDMFLGITLNNITVAFVTFLLGIFFGLGTFFSLLRNGIMLGTFQYFFIERGLFKESFLTIWQHGTLEISAIIVAGAAGFTIGRGLILPGSYSRFQSLRLTARRGLKIMIGLLPIFIMAGFIEGFFTRYTDIPDSIRLMTILLSLFFVLFYFVFYPRVVAKKFPEKIDLAENIMESDTFIPNFKKILSNEALFGGSLKLIKENFGSILKFVLLIASMGGLVIAVGQKLFLPDINESILDRGAFRVLISIREYPLLFFLHALVLGITLQYSAYLITNIKKKSKRRFFNFQRKHLRSVMNSFIAAIFVLLPFYLPIGWGIFLSFIVLPLLLLAFYVAHTRNVFYLTGISITFRLLSKSFGKFVLLNMVFLLLCTLILVLANPGFYKQILSFIHWNLWIEDYLVIIFFNWIAGCIFFISILFGFVLLTTSNNLLYYTLNETTTGEYLINQVKKIGVKTTLRGYELE